MRITPAGSLALDVIRVLSIFAVVVGHYVGFLDVYESSGMPFPIQSYGVVTMFMLSGFLIMGSVHAKTSGFTDFSRYRFVDFLIDRGSRIFVVYWPVVIATVVANNWFAANHGALVKSSGVSNLAVNALMLQLHPWLPPSVDARIDTMAPSWALALEWWIYLLAGWILLVIVAQLRGSGSGVTIWALLVLAVLAIYPMHNLIDGYAMSWFVGAGLFFLYDKIRVTTRSRWLFLGAAVLLFVLCIVGIAARTTGSSVSGIYSTYSYLTTAAWLLCLLVFCQGIASTGGALFSASTTLVRFLAGYMYSLFLTHYTVWYYLAWAKLPFIEEMGARARLTFTFVVANLVALAVGLLLERRGRAVGTFIKRHAHRERVAAAEAQRIAP